MCSIGRKRRCSRRGESDGKKQDHGSAPQESPEGALRINQQPDERKEKQGVAGIRNRNAPRVSIDREVGALAIIIVSALVEAHIAIRENVVHRDATTDGRPIENRKARDVIFGRTRAGMVEHVETIQAQAERQGALRLGGRPIVFRGKGGRRRM